MRNGLTGTRVAMPGESPLRIAVLGRPAHESKTKQDGAGARRDCGQSMRRTSSDRARGNEERIAGLPHFLIDHALSSTLPDLNNAEDRASSGEPHAGALFFSAHRPSDLPRPVVFVGPTIHAAML